MDARPKPAWKDLPQEIQNAWIQQTHAFYPQGSTTLDQATELAQSEYEQSESESLYPHVDAAEQPEVG